ncbi:Alpha/Beta hydrolase fold [Elaphomyces granulatus]|jgi:acetyl esterase/lipase
MAEIAIETVIENKNKMDDYYSPKPKLKPTPKPKLSPPVAATATEKAIAIAAATATETAIEKIKNKTVDYPPKLTLPEKRKLAVTLVYLTGSAGYHSIAGLFRGKKGARYYFIHVAHAIIREALRSMTCREWQYLTSTTRHNYESFARGKHFQPQVVHLERYGGTGYWIGDKKAKNVIVYFHGGGFMISASKLHFHFCWSLLSAVDKDQEPQPQRQQQKVPITIPQTSVFFVDYTLTPHAAYPIQIQQCVEAIHYLVTETHHPFSSITLGGDAAGANLALAVLSHMLHPHPEIDLLLLNCANPTTRASLSPSPIPGSGPRSGPSPVPGSGPRSGPSPVPGSGSRSGSRSGLRSSAREDQFAGLFCIGPWVSFGAYQGWTSPGENRRKDMVTDDLGTTWSRKYLNGRKGDRWNQPILASPAWWRGCPVRRALILAGSEEVFLSSIEEFARRFMAAVPNSVFFVGPDEGHITPISDRMAKYTNNRQGKELMKWLAGIYETLEMSR